MQNDIYSFLLKIDISLSNALTIEEISKGFDDFGITKEIIQTNQLSVKVVIDSISEKQQHEGEKKGTLKSNNELFKKSFETYMEFVTLARLRFNFDDAIVAILGLNGERKRGHSGHIFEGELFYMNILANENILKGFLKYKITKEKIEAGYEITKEFKKSKMTVAVDKEDVVGLTKVVNEKIDALYSFYNEYKTIAKIAFKNKPELLKLILIEYL